MINTSKIIHATHVSLIHVKFVVGMIIVSNAMTDSVLICWQVSAFPKENQMPGALTYQATILHSAAVKAVSMTLFQNNARVA
jgi:hypothetical protein